MTSRTGIEDRIALWMLEEAPDEAPDRVLDAAFERTRVLRQQQGEWGRSRWALAVAAILIIAASIAGLAVIGGLLTRTTEPQPRPDALQRIRSAGIVRVAVSPDHPQATLPDGSLDGFDVDVAGDLARRLGVRLEVVPLSPPDQQLAAGAWDVALPPMPVWQVDPSMAPTTAYYAWPHLLLASTASGASSVTDVEGQPICAVAGDAGQAWVLGRYGATTPDAASTAPIASTLVLRPSDAACLEALAAGSVRAVVTATVAPAGVAELGGVGTLAGGPEPEPRAAVILRDGGDEASLMAAVDRAIRDARADGTLSSLSLARFGSDLTVVVP